MEKSIIKFYTLCLTLLMSSFFVYGQQEQKQVSKEHFIVHKNSSNVDVDKLVAYLNTGYFNLDEYRFYDKRRIIQIEGTTATIELYSAKELLVLYGKEVSPSTIMPNTKFKEVSFALYPDGKGIKPQLK